MTIDDNFRYRDQTKYSIGVFYKNVLHLYFYHRSQPPFYVSIGSIAGDKIFYNDLQDIKDLSWSDLKVEEINSLDYIILNSRLAPVHKRKKIYDVPPTKAKDYKAPLIVSRIISDPGPDSTISVGVEEAWVGDMLLSRTPGIIESNSEHFIPDGVTEEFFMIPDEQSKMLYPLNHRYWMMGQEVTKTEYEKAQYQEIDRALGLPTVLSHIVSEY